MEKTTPPDFRALCAELAGELYQARNALWNYDFKAAYRAAKSADLANAALKETK
jgi:hypothetical protein